MIDPTRSGLSCEFNNFLYSVVGDASGPMPVSVLSALARHNVDPWQEAAQLAQMPKRAAITRLASMISTVNSEVAPQPRAELIATRLIELLPAASILGMARRIGAAHPEPGPRLSLLAGMAVGLLFLVLIIFGN